MNKKIALNKPVKKIVKDMAEIAQHLWYKGWAERNAGNISVNITDIMPERIPNHKTNAFKKLKNTYPGISNNYFLVTGTGKRMHDLSKKNSK